MPDWREEFLAGIIETEQQNPVNRELVDACSSQPPSTLTFFVAISSK
jgi:hypothetical protein